MYLLQVVIARQQGRPADHLRDDAADAPHVELVGLLLGVEDDLWGAVPPRHDLLGQLIISREWVEGARQAEVAYLQVTVLVDEDVGWFDVAVDNPRTVHVEGAAQDLVGEVLDVLVGHFLFGVDDAVQVGVHQFCDDLDVLVVGFGWGARDVHYA